MDVLSLDDIFIDKERKEDDASFEDLVESIETIGLLNPILVVRKNSEEKGHAYRIVCGRRRVRALKRLGHTTVPATVRVMSDVVEEMAVISENVHRLDLGVDRDSSILRYAELHKSLNRGVAKQSELRKAVGMGWINPEALEVQEAMAAPKGKTTIEATADAFGVTPATITKAIRRAKGFTPEQRKVLDDAKVVKMDLDILCSEEPDVVTEVVSLISDGLDFNESMSEALKNHGRVYTGRDGSLEDMDIRLAKTPARRGIDDPEAFDNDCKLFWAIEDELKKFKKAIDWNYKKEMAGKNPRGLYYRRMELFLEARNPRLWVPCRCQTSGDDRWSCAYCRSGAYQIGE